jgi:hypothetical protein
VFVKNHGILSGIYIVPNSFNQPFKLCWFQMQYGESDCYTTDAPLFPENIFHTKQKSDHIFGGHEQFVFYINFTNTSR